jgi:transcriptional regulator of arginine metabolism
MEVLMKSHRHAAILELIDSGSIETQDELAELLRARGIKATQATISRDIKELRLGKILTERGTYRYVVSAILDTGITDRLRRIFADTVLSATEAQNLIVLKTLPGGAQAASEAVDSLNWPEVAGTLAGDNTFLIIVRRLEDVPEIRGRVQVMMESR